MKRFWTLGLVGAALFAASAGAAEPIIYKVTPVLTDGALTAIDVNIHLRADPDGKTQINLPDHWGGGRKFYAYLSQIEVDGAISVTTPAPQTRLITSKPNTVLDVHYRLNATLKAGEEAPSETDYRYPLIGPNRFYLLGPEVFAMIEDRYEDPVAFQWTGAPGWTFASDLEYLPLKASGEDIYQSVLIGGTDVHVAQVETPHTDLRIASAGTFDFQLADFDTKVRKIIATEQAFWGDGQDHFLVTLAPVTRLAGLQSVHGTGLGDSFAMITTPDIPELNLTTTLAHEYFHSWNILKLGGPDSDNKPASGYWFSEGFTDYYGRKLALRAGVIDLNQFVEAWNNKLSHYGNSPVRNAANDRIAADFWNDENVQALAYERGAVFAVWLDAKWRPQDVTLDRFMITLRDAVKTNPKLANTPIMPRLQGVADTLHVPLAEDMALYIAQGADIPLPENAFGGCVRVIHEQVPVFTLGYNPEATRTAEVFAGVDPDSNAYKAGLRNGMKRIERLSGNPDDSNTPLSFRVQDTDGSEKVLSWLPQGKALFDRLRLVIPDGMKAAALTTCANAVAGD